MVWEVAKGGGGGRSSSSRSSSSTKSSSSNTKSTNTQSAPKVSSTPKPSGKSTAKPGSAVIVDGKPVVSSTKTPSNGKNTRATGVVGDNGYTPRFNYYSAPPGSVVYYPQHSVIDYLPWIYLFSQNNSPRTDQAVIVQPDGKEVQAQPAREGVDGLAILNWFILIAVLVAIIGGIVYLVNKKTSKE